MRQKQHDLLTIPINTRLESLYTQEKIACDMGKSAKSKKEKEFYKQELLKIRAEIDNLEEKVGV